MTKTVLRALFAASALLASLGVASAASPPGQPKSGPGSYTDATTEVVKRGLGTANSAVYAYYLAAAPAEPRSVVVLLHAWGAVNPVVYGGWIEELARRGHLVLFPAFQQVGKSRPGEATDFTATLLKSALTELANDPQAKPDTAKLMYLGHSAGAAIALNLAAEARDRGLPTPRMIFALMPGGVASDEKARGVLLSDLSRIDPDTAIVAMVSDKEAQAADRISRRILRETSSVPVTRKLLVRSASDDHGFPALSATLASPASPKEGYDPASIKLPADPAGDPRAERLRRQRWAADMVLSGEQQVLVMQLQRNVTDTLDYLAYWKTFDMVSAAVLAGQDLTALRADPAFVDMGRWTDGWPVRRLTAEMPKAPAEASGEPVPARAGSAGVYRTEPVIQSKQPVTRRQR